MTITIARGESSASPKMVLSYKATQRTKNVIHDIIDREDPDVSLGKAGLRKGRLDLLCMTLTAAETLRTIVAGVGVLTFEDTDLPSLDMSFVVERDIMLELDPDTRTRWVVSFEYQEVAP